MGYYFVLIMLFFHFIGYSQFNVTKLLDQAPLIPTSFGSAYVNSKLTTLSETLDDGRVFKRVKSWEPTLELKKYDEILVRYTDKIDARAEHNSFSLNYSPVKNEEDLEYLKLMAKTADSLNKIWLSYSKRIIDINPDFMPLSEEFGCDEIKASGLKLNGWAEEKNKILVESRERMRSLFDLLQRYFNRLSQIEDPMTNNQVLNHISVSLTILRNWYSEVMIANSHMVETGISLNNSLCMMNTKD